MASSQKLLAEFFGTFWLVLGGCGSAVISSHYPLVGIGLLGISLAFGLTVLTMAYAVGHVSGGHFNPAVSIGLCVAGRFSVSELPGYIIAQVIGAIAAAGVLYLIASGLPGFSIENGFGTNGYGEHSLAKYSMMSGFIVEVVTTFFFLIVILGATGAKAPAGFAPIAIGLALTVIHLISIPVTGTSVNPARSTGPAIFAGSSAIGQLWLFWVAPIIGAALAGLVNKALEPKA
jgi:aquaporin Z